VRAPAAAIEHQRDRPSLRTRDLRPEWMDDPALDADLHRDALRGLARLNRLARPHRAIVRELAPIARMQSRPLRLLDLATGGGDVLRGVLDGLRRRGVRVEATACDISARALETAAAAGTDAAFVRCDALRDPLPAGFDVAMCSLFLHHLEDDDAATLLRRMGEAAPVVIVSDLVRSPLRLAAVHVVSRIVSRSPVVRHDAPQSVRAAFTPDEARSLVHRAGLRLRTLRRSGVAQMLLAAERS
jgi:2-polyprenyl-3-methyl-5-hydroxy-6-metoxy-1,4-benzoquinol methylase